jgi:hypothetical protein
MLLSGSAVWGLSNRWVVETLDLGGMASMADYIADLRRQMQERLRQIDNELRSVQGLLDEKERIKRALEREPFAQPRRARAAANASGRPRRTRRGDTRERFVAFVEQRPGVSVAEVSRGIGIPSTYAHNLATRLTKEGLLERFELPSGSRGLRVAQQSAEETAEAAAS